VDDKKNLQAWAETREARRLPCSTLFKPETTTFGMLPPLPSFNAFRNGAVVRAHDPQAMHEAAKVLPGIKYCSGPYEACEGADAVVLMTEWNEYRALDLLRIKKALKAPVFVDLRNVYRASAMKQLGFEYHSVGRAVSESRKL